MYQPPRLLQLEAWTEDPPRCRQSASPARRPAAPRPRPRYRRSPQLRSPAEGPARLPGREPTPRLRPRRKELPVDLSPCTPALPSPAPLRRTADFLPKLPPSAARQDAGRRSFVMDPNMKQLQEALVDIETDAEQLLLARHQLVENDKMRNANREALTALRKRAKTTKTSIPSPFDVIMKEMEGTSGKQLVKEICPTCGNHDPKEHTWLMFPGSDIFARVPFHVTHTILDKDQERLDYDTKKLQSFVKEKSFLISEKGALADKISPGIVKSLVSLTDKPK